MKGTKSYTVACEYRGVLIKINLNKGTYFFKRNKKDYNFSSIKAAENYIDKILDAKKNRPNVYYGLNGNIIKG